MNWSKFEEEIDDLKASKDAIEPGVRKLQKTVRMQKRKIKRAIEDKKRAMEVKRERMRMLGREE